MKIKFIILIIILLIIPGCKKDTTEVFNYTNVINDNSSIPYFNIPILDNEIKANIVDNNFKLINISKTNTNILCISFKTNNISKTILYDLNNNSTVNMSDLFTEEEYNKLYIIINNKFKSITKDLINNSNFVITSDKLIFYLDEKITIPLNKFTNKFMFENTTFSSINNYAVNEKYVALTFDDGPSKYTSEIYSILKDYNSKATFFIVGNKINGYEKLLKNMFLDGNEIGNHTNSHSWLNKDYEDIINEIKTAQENINMSLNITPTLFRPTYGSINNTIRKASHKLDLELIMWDVDSNDWKYNDPEIIMNNILKDLENYDIILMHDIKDSTVKATELLLERLINDGFQFVTVSEMKIIKAYNG